MPPSRRRSEPRIIDPLTHPKRYVSLRVAAVYLEVDEKTLRKYLASGLLDFFWFGARRKIAVADLCAFELRQRVTRNA